MTNLRVQHYPFKNRLHFLLGLLVLLMFHNSSLLAEDSLAARPWWLGIGLGYGQLRLTSDQNHGESQGVYAITFRGGRKLSQHFRIGAELGGWGLEASDLQDSSVGVDVSNASVIVDVFPLNDLPFYLRIGAGWSSYWTNRPLELGSAGWAWKAGIGYDIEVSPSVSLVTEFSFSQGNLGELHNPIFLETGLRYSAWDIGLGVHWYFCGKMSEQPDTAGTGHSDH